MCLGMANGGKSLTEDLRKKSAIKNTNGIIECDLDLVNKTIQEFAVKVVEEQEHIIMRTIQYIGGEEYSHITIDKNKVVDAFKKQMPKKPHQEEFELGEYCPNCEYIFDGFPNYCEYCGQRIDWSDTDEQNDR